jgi:broad specificity phosphatase PhoE
MAEVMKTDPEGFMGFFSSIDQVAGATGESLIEVQARVRHACADVVAGPHEGKRVAVFSHVTPIKVIVADALGAPLLSVYRSQLDPGGSQPD